MQVVKLNHFLSLKMTVFYLKNIMMVMIKTVFLILFLLLKALLQA